jgi:predicted phage terminase large subunit-like protein
LNRARKATLERRGLPDAYNSLTAFKRHLYKLYNHAPHLEALDSALEQVEEYVRSGGLSGNGRLIVEMPPRHGKTLTVSRLFPIWFLGRNPDKRVMLVSYGATLAHKNSRTARNMVRTLTYQGVFPGVTLAGDSQAVDTWEIADHEGGCDAMGITGGATGKGAHILIIDDPIKNRQEAESDVYRARVWDAYVNDLYTRLEPGGAIIVMMTRWHEDDLIGRLLRQGEDDDDHAEHWHRLRMPAIAEENDPLGRAVGEALWPWRYPLSRLKRIARTVGEYVWNALFQQRPVPAEGGLFKRAKFNRIEHANPAEFECVVRFWDLAMSEKTSADFTVGVKMAKTKTGRYVILDVARKQLEWDEVTRFMADVAARDGAGVRIGFEKKGYMSRAGKALAQDPRLGRHAIFGYPKETDKITNALPLAARVGEDLVDLVDSFFTDTFLDEMCSFPNGAHDDQVDAAAGAYDMLAQQRTLKATTSRWA